jgi:SAM-dependent methyltransferase
MRWSSSKSSRNHCPICGSKRLELFFRASNVPVYCNILWTNRSAAQNCPRANIKLAFCRACSHIFNLEFEPALLKYDEAYESSLDFSPRFQSYARSLATQLTERYSLHNKHIISIGCGKGEFLTLLCKLGNNRGTGFDPAYVEQEKHRPATSQITFIRDLYDERYADYQADLITCRHVLEHVYDPIGFLTTLRRTIGQGLTTRLFFEVPNALNIFHKLFTWDIIYEHYSYFTPSSLALTFSSSGFQVCEITEGFEGQYLCIHASPETQTPPDRSHKPAAHFDDIERDITSFTDNYLKKVETYARKLKQIREKGERAVVWGAGSKGVTFLNTFKNSGIEYAVDINPREQGMYVPGTGQQIVPPDFLKKHRPHVIIVMNPIYRHEIQQTAKKLGLTARLINA